MRHLFEGGAYSRAALIKKLIERSKNHFMKPVKYLKKVISIGKKMARNCSASVSMTSCVKFDTVIKA